MKPTHHLLLSVFVDNNMENEEAVSKYKLILSTLKDFLPSKNIVSHHCFKTTSYGPVGTEEGPSVEQNGLYFTADVCLLEKEILQLRRNLSFALTSVFHAAAIDQLLITPISNKQQV